MAAVRHLEFSKSGNFNSRSGSGAHYASYAKFRENTLNRSGDMADFRFFKMAAAAILDFGNLKVLTVGTVICALGASRRIKQKIKVHLRNHNTCFSRVCSDHPRCRSATWICVCGHTRNPIIYSKFHRNPFRGFGAPGVKIWPFPLLWLVAFTTACTTVQAVILGYPALI